jgi:hypothetical protein
MFKINLGCCQRCTDCILLQDFKWEAINCKQITRWQHVSQLKASSFSSWQQKSLLLKMQQLILGTGTAIWWLTEPHYEQFSRLFFLFRKHFLEVACVTLVISIEVHDTRELIRCLYHCRPSWCNIQALNVYGIELFCVRSWTTNYFGND